MNDHEPSHPPSLSRPCILVVDDSEESLDILLSALHGEFDVSVATSGEDALTLARSPDIALVLLDVNLPDISGYEVCRRLKADPATAELSIIFQTAMNDVRDEALGLAIGAIDYVTKPFEPALLRARVRNHVVMRRHASLVAEQRDRIEDAYRKLEALGRRHHDLVQMVVHDLRSPLSAILANVEFCESGLAPQLDHDGLEALADIRTSALTLRDMVGTLLDIDRLESGAFPITRASLAPARLAEEALGAIRSLAEGRAMTLHDRTAGRHADLDGDVLRRVLVNLFANAIRHTKRGGTITAGLSFRGPWLHVSVEDDGAGIAPEHQAKIFDKFGQVEARRDGATSGVGLTFCRLAVEAHGGGISVQSTLHHGATFHVLLPASASSVEVSVKDPDALRGPRDRTTDPRPLDESAGILPARNASIPPPDDAPRVLLALDPGPMADVLGRAFADRGWVVGTCAPTAAVERATREPRASVILVEHRGERPSHEEAARTLGDLPEAMSTSVVVLGRDLGIEEFLDAEGALGRPTRGAARVVPRALPAALIARFCEGLLVARASAPRASRPPMRT